MCSEQRLFIYFQCSSRVCVIRRLEAWVYLLMWRCDEWLFEWKRRLPAAVSDRSWQSRGLSMFIRISTRQQPSQLHKYAFRIMQGAPKIAPYFLFTLCLSNIYLFSKLFRCQNMEKICNNTITKDLSTPQVCRYTTLCLIKAPRWGILFLRPRPILYIYIFIHHQR